MSGLARRYWHMLRGFAAYESLARTSKANQIKVLRVCASCPSAVLLREDQLAEECPGLLSILGHPPVTLWCGRPGVPTDTTCGCLLGAEPMPGTRVDVTIERGDVSYPLRARGKTECEGVECPQGHWRIESTRAHISPSAPATNGPASTRSPERERADGTEPHRSKAR